LTLGLFGIHVFVQHQASASCLTYGKRPDSAPSSFLEDHPDLVCRESFSHSFGIGVGACPKRPAGAAIKTAIGPPEM